VKHEAEDTFEDQRRQIHALQEILENNRSVTEEDLDNDLRARQLELMTFVAEQEQLDEEIDRLSHIKRQLQRELLTTPEMDRTAPLPQQIAQAAFYLKAKGVSTFHDLKYIQEAREEAARNGIGDVMEKGVQQVKRVLARLARPQKLTVPSGVEWFAGEALEKAKRKSIERASIGICRIVTAVDMINPNARLSWTKTTPEGREVFTSKHKFGKEILANLGVLLEVAVRQYRYRRNEDPRTGEPLEKLIERKKRRQRLVVKTPARPRRIQRFQAPLSTAGNTEVSTLPPENQPDPIEKKPRRRARKHRKSEMSPVEAPHLGES
jgi:hypothetical protein